MAGGRSQDMDEGVKVSSDDTTSGFLIDKLIVADESNSADVLETKEVNPAADEDLKIAFDETKIVHDNVSGSGTNTHAQIDAHIADYITSNTTLNIPASYADIEAAITSIEGKRIAPDVTVTIQIANGTYSWGKQTIDHIDGKRIEILGNVSDNSLVNLDFTATTGLSFTTQDIKLINGLTVRGNDTAGTYGIFIINSSSINFGIKMKIQDFWVGLIVATTSNVVADSLVITSCTNVGMSVQSCSRVLAPNSSSTSNGTYGYSCIESASINASNADSDNNSSDGYNVQQNGVIMGSNLSADNNGGHGFHAATGGVISGTGTPVTTNNSGYGARAILNAVVSIPGATITGNSLGTTITFAGGQIQT